MFAQKQPSRGVLKTYVFRNFRKVFRETSAQNIFNSKVAGMRLKNLNIDRFWQFFISFLSSPEKKKTRELLQQLFLKIYIDLNVVTLY